jgi:hypothetical protein
MNGGAFYFGKSPPSAGHISHPADGSALAKAFAVPFLLEIFCEIGCVAGGKKICFRLLRATSVFAFGLPKANASVEFAYSRANMSEAEA